MPIAEELNIPGTLSRHKARENAFITLFSTMFGNTMDEAIEVSQEPDADCVLDDFSRGLLCLYRDNSQTVDHEIESKLKDWSVGRLPKVNLAILRLAVAEMLFAGGSNTDNVIINEAVELAKRFGDEPDYQFVNGVLGSISREKNAAAASLEEQPEQRAENEKEEY